MLRLETFNQQIDEKAKAQLSHASKSGFVLAFLSVVCMLPALTPIEADLAILLLAALCPSMSLDKLYREFGVDQSGFFVLIGCCSSS